MARRVLEHEKINVVWDSVVEEVLGDDTVTTLRLRNVVSGDTTTFPVDGMFVAIGHTPNTGIFSDWLDFDDEGYILTEPGTTRTSVEGVFAAGDVVDKVYRQAVTAAGMGCQAAIDAERWLHSQHV